MNKVCYTDLWLQAARAGDSKKAKAVLDQGLNFYSAQLMALFNSAYMGDWPMILAALELARPGLYERMGPLKSLEKVLVRGCSATMVSVPVDRGGQKGGRSC